MSSEALECGCIFLARLPLESACILLARLPLVESTGHLHKQRKTLKNFNCSLTVNVKQH